MKIMTRHYLVAVVAFGLAHASVATSEHPRKNGVRRKARLLFNTQVDALAVDNVDKSSEFWGRQLEGEIGSVSYAEIADHDSIDGQSGPPSVTAFNTISNYFKYETQLWNQRNLKGWSSLDIAAFDEALVLTSAILCDIGITATLFDDKGEQVFQKTVGSTYASPAGGYLNFSAPMDNWSGDTPMAVYSNAKGLAATTFLASVVDTGLGFLDEPIYLTFPDLLTESDQVGRATPRMILSHTSGLATYDRNNATGPYYSCIYDDTTVLADCLGLYLFIDETMKWEPGSKATYSNEPFDILAEIAVRKTGLDNYGEVFKKYITEPLGMSNTSYDCPVVQSTSAKPHVGWGVCSTAHDMAKWVQMLSKHGIAADGTQILSNSSVQQIFTRQQGWATNSDETLFPMLPVFPMTRCYQRLGEPEQFYMPSSLMGYGLGTMFWPGNKGQLLAHAGTTGGLWVVAPGRYAAYFGWQHNPAGFFYGSSAYATIANILDPFEQSSTFKVSNSHRGMDDYEELITCGGDMLIDLWAHFGVENVFDSPVPVVAPQPPECATRRRTSAVNGPILSPHMETLADFLRYEL